MTLTAQLLDEVSAHYSERGFPRESVERLLKIIEENLTDGRIVLQGTYQMNCAVGDLLGRFPKSATWQRVAIDAAKVDALFAFSFGYRIKSRLSEGIEQRLPGPNNRALAKIACELRSGIEAPLCVQFEISDALNDYWGMVADFCAVAQDGGTAGGIQEFLSFLQHQQIDCRRVLVVAHKHHVGRCMALLAERGINGVLPAVEYDQYDSQEAQPRVKNASEYIVSDFVSMAAIYGSRRSSDRKNDPGEQLHLDNR